MNKLPPAEGPEDEVGLEEVDMNGEVPDSFYQDEMRDAEVQKLSHRFTMLTILLPCLLGAILLLGYLDLRQRVIKTRATGSKKVQTLSQDFVDKIASLSYQYETLDASLTEALEELNKSSAEIKDRLIRDEQKIENLTASKIDKETFSTLQKEVADQGQARENLSKELREKLDEGADAVAVLRENLQGQKKEIAVAVALIEAIRKEIGEQESAIQHALEGKVEKKAFDEALEKERAGYQEKMVVLGEKIKSIEHELSWLEKQMDTIQTSTELPEAESPQPKAESASESSSSTDTPAPERILEQEIMH